MGVPTPTSIDNVRTHWTPAMDRYFINLMLEHVQKGSKIDDHLFSKQAWTNMTASLNIKFGSQYDKDVLKNHHKTLTKLYKAVTKLLDVSGFSWDSTLQMVVADDDVWDNYVKAHPDARMYRTKTVPYYSALCTIYKNEVGNLDHDSNLENDSPETKSGGFLEGPKSPVTPITNKVQESSSLLSVTLDTSNQQNMLQSLMPSTSLQSSDEGMVEYSEMKIDGFLEDSKSSDMSDVYGDLIDNEEVDMSYEHNMHQHFMPSTIESRNDNEVMLDLSGTEIGGEIEGPKSLELAVMHADQVDYVEEPSVHFGVDVDATNHQNKQQSVVLLIPEQRKSGEGMVGTPEIRTNQILDESKSSKVSVADVDQLNMPSSHSDEGVDVSNQHNMVEVDTYDEPNKEQTVISSTTQLRPDKCIVENDHKTVILTDHEANVIPRRNGMDELQDAPDALDSSFGINRLRTIWTPPMDRYFIDLMLDQVHEGNMIDGAGRKQAWKKMIALFNAKFSFQYDTEILKNRYKTLRRHYNAVKFILDQPGFNWDDTKKMVTADDIVWHDYLKAHPDAGQYRTRIMPYYNDLCAIYSDAIVDGRLSSLSCELVLSDNIPAMTNRKSLMHLQSPTTSGAHGDSNKHQNKRRLTTPLTLQDSKKLRSSSDRGMADALREMATAVSSLARKKKENSNNYSIENVIASLQSLPDIDDDLLLDACDFLEDEKKGKTFLALDVSLRKKWLMRKLRS